MAEAQGGVPGAPPPWQVRAWGGARGTGVRRKGQRAYCTGPGRPVQSGHVAPVTLLGKEVENEVCWAWHLLSGHPCVNPSAHPQDLRHPGLKGPASASSLDSHRGMRTPQPSGTPFPPARPQAHSAQEPGRA